MKKKTKKLTPTEICNTLAKRLHMLHTAFLSEGFSSEEAFKLTHSLIFNTVSGIYNEENG